MAHHFDPRTRRKTLAGCWLSVGLALGPAAALARPVFLITPTSRSVFCDPGEGCHDHVCGSDGVTACAVDADCPLCITVGNNDVAMCRPATAADTVDACHWTLFFDGAAAGLDAAIRALDALPDGSLVLRAGADNSVPDIAGVSRKDLVRFTPKDGRGHSTAARLPYRQGAWDLFLDGDAVERNSDARLIEGLDVLSESCRDVNGNGRITMPECDVLFSPVVAGTLAGIDIDLEDILRCRPTLLSPGGAIEACEYTIFYDASSVGLFSYPPPLGSVGWGSWLVGGTPSFAIGEFDPQSYQTELYFMAGNTDSLPTHQPARDLLLSIGQPGPRGMCSGTDEEPCLADSDCLAGGTCLYYANPLTSVPTSLAFDGSVVMPRETIAGLAVLGDRDGDGIPDPIDNCADIANPGHCGGPGGRECISGSDCDEAECLQDDADDDGVGDACDRCLDRDDALCGCGDFVVDAPVEHCDLGDPSRGGFNGVEGSHCSLDCLREGLCTRSGAPCSQASDCSGAAAGEGCCGDGVWDDPDGSGGVEADEVCDDGNSIGDDACDTLCRATIAPIPLPVECQGTIGPRLTPTFVRALRFRKQRAKVAADRQPDQFSKWSSRGEFSLGPGLPFDPDSQTVEVIFSQDRFVCAGGAADGSPCTSASDCVEGRCTSALYRAALPPGSFSQGGKAFDRPRWDFDDHLGRTAGAYAWTEGRFIQRLATIHRRLNSVKYRLKGRGERSDPQVSIHVDPLALGGPPTRIRQTILVGGLCTTQTLVCEPNANGMNLTCYSRSE